MTIGVVLVMVQTFIQLRYKFRNVNRTECAASPSPDDSRFEMILKDLEEKVKAIENFFLQFESNFLLSAIFTVFHPKCAIIDQINRDAIVCCNCLFLACIA